MPVGEAVLTDTEELFTAWPAEPKPSDSPLDPLGAALSGYTLYFAKLQTLLPGDKLSVRGVEHYVVSGAEWRWPSSGVAGYVVQVARLNLPQTVTVEPNDTWTDDSEGNAIRGTGTPLTYPGLLYQPSPTEIEGSRTTESVTWQLLLPADAVITEHDRVTADGLDYEVDGLPYRVTSGVPHVEVRLKRG